MSVMERNYRQVTLTLDRAGPRTKCCLTLQLLQNKFATHNKESIEGLQILVVFK